MPLLLARRSKLIVGILCIGFSCLSAGLLKAELEPAVDMTKAHIDFDIETLNDRALERLGEDALLSNRKLAQQANEILLARSNDCLECFHRAVFLSLWGNDNAFTDEVANYLRQSYRLSPLGDLETMQWRVNLSKQYWDSLPADLKAEAKYQVKGLNASRPGREWMQRNPIDFP